MEAASTLSKTGMIANTATISCVDGMEKVKFNFHVAWRKNSISRDFFFDWWDHILSRFYLRAWAQTSWLCCLWAFTIKLGALRTMMIQKRWSREDTKKTATSNWCEGNRLKLTQKTFISAGEDEALDSLLLCFLFFFLFIIMQPQPPRSSSPYRTRAGGKLALIHSRIWTRSFKSSSLAHYFELDFSKLIFLARERKKFIMKLGNFSSARAILLIIIWETRRWYLGGSWRKIEITFMHNWSEWVKARVETNLIFIFICRCCGQTNTRNVWITRKNI